MKTDSKIREGFHSIEILLKNKPEVIKKVIVPEAREDARMLKLLQACSDNYVTVERSKKIKKNPQATVSSMDIGNLRDLKRYLENLSNIRRHRLSFVLQHHRWNIWPFSIYFRWNSFIFRSISIIEIRWI